MKLLKNMIRDFEIAVMLASKKFDKYFKPKIFTKRIPLNIKIIYKI